MTWLPTVLVEGEDDKTVYRYIEEKFGDLDIDILPCFGRDALLKVFKRKEEYEGSKVAFVADKDMWYFTGIPEEYKENIIFSYGYSIENDLYVREIFEKLLEKEEKELYIGLIKELSKWFAFEVERYRNTGECLCDIHVNQVVPDFELNKEYLEKVGFSEPAEKLIDEIFEEYHKALRGKNLFQALLRFLSKKKRASKYSRENLFEMGAKMENGVINNLYEKLKVALYETDSKAG
ncbi:DUF4435 domain-containing protein [Hahella aquimaris]|uniref:DUF4435 domain-containing protein n=1 Tax=Hahella sp. HNIBRBA332 TaxID=3015983 RepID=UPI00273BFEBA|nr:DUF4435 domain-containing protein [Hahella sp. HNIBRBA332]WLQ17478.1 DUF4435 domain-containing protein [Hahella sp. HNIBRBA332]